MRRLQGLLVVLLCQSVKSGHNMPEMWSTFARTGKTAAKGQPEWLPTDSTRATMEIDADCKVVNDPYPLEREIWERLDPCLPVALFPG